MSKSIIKGLLVLLLIYNTKTSVNATSPSDDYENYNVYGGGDEDNYDGDDGNPDGVDADSVARDEDGNYVLGDMILSPEQFNYEFGDGPVENSGIRGDQFRWTDGVVPIQFTSGISQRERSQVEKSLAKFSKSLGRNCIKFRPATSSDRNKIMITRSGSGICGQSRVGRQRSSQSLGISTNCFNDRTIIHEFIHALGFFHEQSRPDRDEFVTINFQNINPRFRYNFNKRRSALTFGVPYDGRSMMHYRSKAFSTNGRDTITSKIPNVPTNQLGSARFPTQFDLQKVRGMYKCDKPRRSEDDEDDEAGTDYYGEGGALYDEDEDDTDDQPDANLDYTLNYEDHLGDGYEEYNIESENKDNESDYDYAE